MAANAGETKVKLWEGICYPENMLEDWQEEIDDILQVPRSGSTETSFTDCGIDAAVESKDQT